MVMRESSHGLTLGDIVLRSGIGLKLIMALVVLCGLAVFSLSIMRRLKKAPTSALLTGMGLCALSASAFSVPYQLYYAFYEVRLSDPANVTLLITQTVVCVGAGLIVMVIAVIGNWGAPKPTST